MSPEHSRGMFCLYSPAAGMCRSRKLQLFKFYTCVKLYVSTEAVSFSLLWTARGIGELGDQRAGGIRWPTGCRLGGRAVQAVLRRHGADSVLGFGIGYTGLEAVLHTVDPVFSHADTSRVRCDSVFD